MTAAVQNKQETGFAHYDPADRGAEKRVIFCTAPPGYTLVFSPRSLAKRRIARSIRRLISSV